MIHPHNKTQTSQYCVLFIYSCKLMLFNGTSVVMTQICIFYKISAVKLNTFTMDRISKFPEDISVSTQVLPSHHQRSGTRRR